MEKLYKKVGKKYVEVGYNLPDIPDGFYFSQKIKNGTRTTSVNYWLGSNPQEPVELQKLVQVMQHDDALASFLNQIQDKNSDEFKKLNNDCNHKLSEATQILNISTHDLSVAILRFIFKQLKGKNDV